MSGNSTCVSCFSASCLLFQWLCLSSHGCLCSLVTVLVFAGKEMGPENFSSQAPKNNSFIYEPLIFEPRRPASTIFCLACWAFTFPSTGPICSNSALRTRKTALRADIRNQTDVVWRLLPRLMDFLKILPLRILCYTRDSRGRKCGDQKRNRFPFPCRSVCTCLTHASHLPEAEILALRKCRSVLPPKRMADLSENPRI